MATCIFKKHILKYVFSTRDLVVLIADICNPVQRGLLAGRNEEGDRWGVVLIHIALLKGTNFEPHEYAVI